MDLTWTSPYTVRFITSWEVVTDTDTLSDHRYIRIGVCSTLDEMLRRRDEEGFPRQWTLRKLDIDSLMAAVLAKSLCSPGEGMSIRDQVE
jgi:hypothetical protein